MGITLSTNYQAELRKGLNQPDSIFLVELDSGDVKWGFSTGVFSDVKPILEGSSSLQNRLDFKKSVARSGDISLTIVGRDNFKALVRDEYLKNRRVTRYDGFVAPGFQFSDYAATFTGLIRSWSRKGDLLTIRVADDKSVDSKKIPVENVTKTQTIDYRDTNIIDVMKDIVGTQLAVPTGQFDGAKFDSEKLTWYLGWNVNRVLHRPEDANILLAELSRESHCYVFHDGAKVTCKAFAPPEPGQTVPLWSDESNILVNSLECDSGYEDMFYNGFVIYYDYDEGGGNKSTDFEGDVYILADADSQGAAEWDEASVLTIKSKWIRTYTHTTASAVTGTTVYHVSTANGAGDGTLTCTVSGGVTTLSWEAPGGTAGDAVEMKKSGTHQLFDADKTSYCRVVVDVASLPGSTQSDTITISVISGGGEELARSIAGRLRSYYRDPVSKVKFSVGLNDINNSGEFLVPTDLVDLTTDEAFEKGDSTWVAERMMLTSVRPDFEARVVRIEAVETKMYLDYRFISAFAFDYNSASQVQKDNYMWIADVSDKLGSADDDPHVIWFK